MSEAIQTVKAANEGIEPSSNSSKAPRAGPVRLLAGTTAQGTLEVSMTTSLLRSTTSLRFYLQGKNLLVVIR